MYRVPTNAQSAMYEGRWKDCREKLKVALRERDEARAEAEEATARYLVASDVYTIKSAQAHAAGYRKGVEDAAKVVFEYEDVDEDTGAEIYTAILALLEQTSDSNRPPPGNGAVTKSET